MPPARGAPACACRPPFRLEPSAGWSATTAIRHTTWLDTTEEETSKAPGGGGKAKKNADSATTSKAPVPTDAQLVAESTCSLALPAGWERVMPASGATFAAVSPDSAADATLWVQNDPKLDMAAFEVNSLQQLEVLAGSARRRRA